MAAFSPLLTRLEANIFNLYVEPLQSGRKLWRTLHPSLPRTPLPGPPIPIQKLRLDGLHFPTGQELSRLLLSIPSLVHLKAFNLTFDAEPKPKHFSFRRQPFDSQSDNLHLRLSLVLFLNPF